MYKLLLLWLMVIPVTTHAGFVDWVKGKLNGQVSPSDVVKKYFAAKSWEERLPLLKNGESLRTVLAKHYKGITFPIECKFSAKEIEIPEHPKSDDIAQVQIRCNQDMPKTYFLRFSDGKWLIEWEASVGYNPMTAQAYKVQRPRTHLTFRVWVKITGQYPFDDCQNCQTVSLGTEAGEYLPEGAMSLQHTKRGKELFEILKDGEEHAITVKVAMIQNWRKDDVPLIVDYLSPSWLYTAPKEEPRTLAESEPYPGNTLAVLSRFTEITGPLKDKAQERMYKLLAPAIAKQSEGGSTITEDEFQRLLPQVKALGNTSRAE